MKRTIFRICKIPKSGKASVILLGILISGTLISFRPANGGKYSAYNNFSNPSVEKRIDSIVSVMTLEEKVAMLCGNGLFSSAGVERLGIPELHYTDGPFGIREELGKNSWAPLGWKTDSATFFPTGSALAATWNPELAYKYGTGIGEEAKTRGKDILLGPAVNITRTPVNGRTFEYFSEDPLLNAKLTVGYIKGVQDRGVAACVKHFAVNNQETNRGAVDVKLDERTLREIYLPAFKAAVTEAGVYTVMSAYNKIRGHYCAENDYLLNKILRDEWGFKGFVMSDWGGTHSTVNSALNGLDVEMGTKLFFNNKLLEAVKKGDVPVSVIDEKVRRILRVNFFAHSTPAPAEGSVVSTPAHGKIVYDVALQSIVLLKNSANLLPLNLKNVKSIAVIGDNATHKHAFGGFGAGVKARYEVTPLDGLKAKVGSKAVLNVVQGYKPKFLPRKGQGFGKELDNTPNMDLIKEAVEAAKKSDVAIIFAGTNHDVETEATDRKDIELPFGQDELIKAVSAVNKNTIVVVVAAAPCNLKPTSDVCSTIVWSWYNGSQGGNALADILLGNANPSGRLPLSFPVKLEDSPAHALKAFPGDRTVTYAEGILVGYRWFTTKQIKPMYPFGYGLSYTSFQYSGLKTDKPAYSRTDSITVTLKIKNTGKRAGMETVQLYAGKPDSKVLRSVKELRAFKKVEVGAGKESAVTMKIAVSDLAYFDESQMKWVVEPGTYSLMAAASSEDVKGTVSVKIQ